MADTDTTRRIEYVPLDDLQPDPRNPKAHDVATIDGSTERFGYVEPVVVDERTGLLVSGHGRRKTLEAMRARGETPPEGLATDDEGRWLVPVVRGWASRTDSDASAALVALNRTGELGGWVDDELLSLLDDLDDLTGVGYDADSIEALRDQLAALDDRSDPWSDRGFQPIPDPGEVERGQVWQAGDHLMVCGDSRDPDLWTRLLAGRKVDLLFTDPPYGIGYSGGGGVEREALEGDADGAEAVALLGGALDALSPVVAPGCCSYICLPPGTVFPPFASDLLARGLYRWLLVWVKHKATFGRADYHPQHEVIVYGWWPGPHHPVEDRTQTTVWEVPRPADSDRHPTAKPVPLARRAIENSTDEGALVVDPFAGSFSTVMAAHRAGRVGVGVEWEPGYVSEALRWFAEETGAEPVLLDVEVAVPPAEASTGS